MKWLPSSLASRVFALYALAILAFLSVAFGLFYRAQFVEHIEEAQDSAAMLVEVAAQPVQESAVIGDYDTIKRTLQKLLVHTPFRAAAFISVDGGAIRLQNAPYHGTAPVWLHERIAARLYDVNYVVTAGGHDYGVMRLTFDAARISSQLWRMVVQALALALTCLVTALVIVRVLLRRWLGHLDKLQAYEAKVAAGDVEGEALTGADAPAEIRQAIQAVNRTAASLRDHFGQRIKDLISALVQHKSAMDEAAIVSEIGLDGRLTYVNDLYVRMSGYAREQLVGRHIDDTAAAASPAAPWTGGRQAWRGEIQTAHADGRRGWRKRTIVPIFGAAEEVEKYICIDVDITREKEVELALKVNATHDSLTGLPNRLLLHDRIAQAITAAERQQQSMALLFVDFDHFKYVNDGYGHEVGDRLLQGAARRLMAQVRKGDTVARLGGDEFVIVLAALPSGRADAQLVADKLLESFREPLNAGDHQFTMSASVGIGVYPYDGRTADELLMKADTAMYRAKESGRNAARFFSAEMNNKALERVSLEAALRQALAARQLELYYQPQISLENGRVVGAEALLRWRHPRFGVVPPNKFIAVAEECGLIVPIGEWVLNEACRQARIWHDGGMKHMRVSVNLSARQLGQPSLCASVTQALEAAALNARFLNLELTESTVMRDSPVVARCVNELRALGASLSLDDFGTGHSSLASLKTYPLAEVKIDRSFVRDLPHNGDAAAIARAIVSMARSLRLRCVAEGVETGSQDAFMRELGCDTVQGFFYSKPLPAAEFTEWLHAYAEEVCGEPAPRAAA